MRVASTLLSLLLPIATLWPQAVAGPLPCGTVEPSLLAHLLKSGKNLSVQRKLLGTWSSGRAKATFEAIIASEPGKPAEKTKGLEIRMEEGTRHATVYLDYEESDSLTQFQRNLAFVMRERDRASQDGTVSSSLTQASNRATPSQQTALPRKVVFNAGWYRTGSESGVLLAAVETCQSFHFPDGKLEKLVEIIAAARAFLEAN